MHFVRQIEAHSNRKNTGIYQKDIESFQQAQAIKTNPFAIAKRINSTGEKITQKTTCMNQLIDSLQQKVNDLNEQLDKEKSDKEAMKARYEKIILQSHVQAAVNDLTSGYKTVFDSLPGTARNHAIKMLIDKALTEKNGEFTLDDNGKLILKTHDGSNVFGENNIPWDATMLIENTLRKNKILVSAAGASDKANPSTEAGQNVSSSQPAKNEQQLQPKTYFSHLVAQSINDFEKSSNF